MPSFIRAWPGVEPGGWCFPGLSISPALTTMAQPNAGWIPPSHLITRRRRGHYSALLMPTLRPLTAPADTMRLLVIGGGVRIAAESTPTLTHLIVHAHQNLSPFAYSLPIL